MKKRQVFFSLFVILLGFGLQSLAQFTPEELQERAKWEEFLRTSEIVGQEQMKGRQAVTEPWKLTLKKDNITRFALWKSPEGRQKGFVEGWKYEIAAYLLDKYLGLNMVPPTVEKSFQGSQGSCQLWVEYEMNLRDKVRKGIETPSSKLLSWSRAGYLQQAFDNLIGNEDRHQGNVLITKDWRTILIDHSRSFRTSGKFVKRLIYSEKNIEDPVIMRELPRAFVDKIRALNFELIKNIVGEYLTDKEIEAVLARKDLILEEIGRRVKKFGESTVLY
jgi:hypothetical protein